MSGNSTLASNLKCNGTSQISQCALIAGNANTACSVLRANGLRQSTPQVFVGSGFSRVAFHKFDAKHGLVSWKRTKTGRGEGLSRHDAKRKAARRNSLLSLGRDPRRA